MLIEREYLYMSKKKYIFMRLAVHVWLFAITYFYSLCVCVCEEKEIKSACALITRSGMRNMHLFSCHTYIIE